MKGQDSRNSHKPKPIVELAVVGTVLATVFCALHGTAHGCSMVDRAAWIALEALRPVLVAAWRSVPACHCQVAGLLGQVLQIATSVGPLLCSLSSLV
jgi:hypothetical protein